MPIPASKILFRTIMRQIVTCRKSKHGPTSSNPSERATPRRLKPLEIRYSNLIRKSSENSILVLTHGDLLPAEGRITARLKICEFLGVPETLGAYDIPCLTEQGILAEERERRLIRSLPMP
ncbi:hypothetical protein QQ045_025889 [Rhodiola kirilowii]